MSEEIKEIEILLKEARNLVDKQNQHILNYLNHLSAEKAKFIKGLSEILERKEDKELHRKIERLHILIYVNIILNIILLVVLVILNFL